MDRRKFTATLVALVTGLALSAGSALAQTGYLMGDAAPAKLVPFYRVGPTLATIIGFENVEETEGPNDPDAEDINVHITIFGKRSNHVLNLDLCLSPFDFGFIVLQQNGPNDTQQDELDKRGHKVAVVSVAQDGIPTEGYVLVHAKAEFESSNGKCTGDIFEFPQAGSPDDHEGLATWAILADIGQGFFATEIPTPTVNVNPFTLAPSGGINSPLTSFGLIPGPPLVGTGNPFDEFPLVGNPAPSGFDPVDVNVCFASGGLAPTCPSSTVIARFDVNPFVDSHTEIYVWLQRNAFVIPNDPGAGINRFGASQVAFLDCEDESEFSTTIFLPDEVNIINPDALAGIGQCKAREEYRGVLRFKMPDTGFLWSNISQEGEHFRQTYLGYNLGDNDFIDCADGVNDFDNTDDGTPSGDPESSSLPLC